VLALRAATARRPRDQAITGLHGSAALFVSLYAMAYTTGGGCAEGTTRSTRSAPPAQHWRARRFALPRSAQR